MESSIKHFEKLKEFSSSKHGLMILQLLNYLEFSNEEQNIPIDPDPFIEYLKKENVGTIIYDVNHESTDFFKQKSVCPENVSFFDSTGIFFLEALGKGGSGKVQKAYQTK